MSAIESQVRWRRSMHLQIRRLFSVELGGVELLDTGRPPEESQYHCRKNPASLLIGCGENVTHTATAIAA
jgi:hypothetical protein